MLKIFPDFGDLYTDISIFLFQHLHFNKNLTFCSRRPPARGHNSRYSFCNFGAEKWLGKFLIFSISYDTQFGLDSVYI